MKNTIYATDKTAQYDASAKRLLGQKMILAHILVHTVKEFQGMRAADIVSCIEGEPYISTVPVDPGLTNSEKEKDGQRIVGFNSENQELNEGLIRFDIIFYVRLKDGLSQIIINVEAQKEEPAEYHILNRAVFYTCRMISSQKERDFTGSDFNQIKQVYSIWVCMNMSENSMDYIHLAKESLVNSYPWKGRLDLVNIVLIGLSDLPPLDEKYELHRLLCALFSDELTLTQKLDIIETEYKIPLDQTLREDVNVMCNLSDGIEEKAAKKAAEEATKIATERVTRETNEKVIKNMHKNGYTTAQIAEIVEVNESEVEAVIRENKIV